jgi:fructan beta-fructosidase
MIHKNTIRLLISLALLLPACNASQPDGDRHKTTQQQHRPQFHFTPPQMWMNDPNGMVYLDGEYHLFYQHYPDSTVWGPMHWGHAVSKDLIRWEHLPIALYPDSLGYIFSGSAVVDKQNTSGFGRDGRPPLVAIYTYHSEDGAREGRNDFQTQGIAYSLDNGRTWEKYDGNPVLQNPGIRDFRDPKVFRHEESGQWIMILAVLDHVELYGSKDLKAWTKLSEFGKSAGAHGGVWECPDLFPLPVEGQQTQKWVMLVSINPGGIYGGSATQYFIGDFDGKEFTNDNTAESVLWLDHGKDNYAGVTWSNIPEQDGRRIFMGWMSNWQYANVVPTENWRSAMTIARTLELKNTAAGLRLTSTPVKEIDDLRGQTYDLPLQQIVATQELADVPFDVSTAEIVLEFELSADDNDFGVKLSNERGQAVTIGFNAPDNRFYVDRSRSGKSDFSDAFEGIHSAPRLSTDKSVKFHLLVDVASVEVFADDGEVVLTDIFFPDEDYDRITLFSKAGTANLRSGRITHLSPESEK